MEDLEIVFFFLLSRIDVGTNIYCVEDTMPRVAHPPKTYPADSGIPQLAQVLYPETHAKLASSRLRFLQLVLSMALGHRGVPPLSLHQTHPATLRCLSSFFICSAREQTQSLGLGKLLTTQLQGRNGHRRGCG